MDLIAEEVQVSLQGEFLVGEFRVLLVDDDKDVRHLLMLGLSRMGFADVDDAADGVVALSKCEQNTYDCIVLDFNMPIMNGDTVARSIRQLWPEVPIIVVTGNPDACEKAFTGVASRIVAKPVSLAELKGWIRECVAGKVTSESLKEKALP